MDNNVTKTMLQAVEAVKEAAKKAEKEYDKGASEIKRMASQQIRLGVGTAVGKVSTIAQKTRAVSDAYYASLQTLVKILDDQCRPLLALDPDLSAIKSVRDTVKWLNDESEIKATFSASVNTVSRGDVAAVSYAPTLDNKLIEKFWQNTYEMHPKKEEAEKAEREKAKAEQKAREDRIRTANEAYAKTYEAELAAWTVKRAEIEKKRSAEVQKELARLKKDRATAIETAFKEETKNAKNAKTFNENKKLGHERALEKLGFFSFGKKKEAKEGIEVARYGIEEASKRLTQAEATYQNELAGLDAWVKKKEAELSEQARQRYPMPKKPRKRTAYSDPKKVVDESIRQEIYDTMEPGKRYTADELIEQISVLADFTRITVLGHLRAMIGVELERIEEPRAAYFRLIDT